MKKKLALLFALITMLVVAGCGGSEESQPVYEMSDEYFNLDINDYVKLCETIPYNELFHNIDSNQGTRVKYIAKVDQVILESTEEPSEYVLRILDVEAEEFYLELAEASEYETEDYAFAYFMHGEGVRLIEGDYIILYGEPWGVQHVSDGNNNEVDIPRLNLAKVQRFED